MPVRLNYQRERPGSIGVAARKRQRVAVVLALTSVSPCLGVFGAVVVSTYLSPAYFAVHLVAWGISCLLSAASAVAAVFWLYRLRDAEFAGVTFFLLYTALVMGTLVGALSAVTLVFG